MKPKPIKRHPVLQPLNREHHQGLLLSWKIRTGIAKRIAYTRIKAYTDWFYRIHLIPHFAEEEAHIFPILGEDHHLVKKALAQHRRLKRLFNTEKDIEKSLGIIEEELEQHIRFEECILFNEIQKKATEQQLQTIAFHQNEKEFIENSSDMFWK